MIDHVRRGMTTTPALLLDPLQQRVASLADEQRFEEAAWVRDRYQALARAIERRRAWRTLERAGRIWAESPEGAACIDHGRLIASWVRGEPTPLIPPFVESDGHSQVPDSVAQAEEAHLIWRWLMTERVKLLESTNPLTMPAQGVAPLSLVA